MSPAEIMAAFAVDERIATEVSRVCALINVTPAQFLDYLRDEHSGTAASRAAIARFRAGYDGHPSSFLLSPPINCGSRILGGAG